MISIPLSAVGSAKEFAAAVEAHRHDIEAHLSGEPGQAAPAASDLIEALIVRMPASGPVAKRGPDKITIGPYEIVDDTPPPPTLDERKAVLMGELSVAAQSARNADLSPARQQLLAMDIGPAMAEDESARTDAQKATISLQETFAARCVAINRTFVEAAVEIEDLTEATIKAWKLPSF